MSNGLAIYKSVTRDLTKALDRSAKDPLVARETKYYLATIGTIKSSKEFVANDRILHFAASAFGLGDLASSKAFLKKMLDGGIDDPNALANRLTDSRYRAFVKNFNSNRYGEATTAFDRTHQGTVDLYTRQSLETTQGQSSEQVRLALYFQRNAPNLTSTISILADKAVFEVVRTALGLPLSFANSNLDKQVSSLDKRVKVADFKDPAKLDLFLKRYFALSEATTATTSGSPGLAVLQSAASPSVSISTDLLAQLQSFKLGGR